jgi:hypothetical protein
VAFGDIPAAASVGQVHRGQWRIDSGQVVLWAGGPARTMAALTRRSSSEGEATSLDPVICFFGRGQERGHRVGDGIGGSPG